MSRTEMHIGKLTEVQIDPSEAVEDVMLRLLEREGVKKIDDINEAFNDHFWKKFLVHRDRMYRIDDKEYIDDDIFEFKREEDGTISYVTTFYNGGTCLPEVLEEIIDNLNGKK